MFLLLLCDTAQWPALMDDSTHPQVDSVVDLLERNAQDEALAWLDQIETAPASDRKTVLRSLKAVAEDHPSVLDPVASALTRFLEDDERAVRLTTAKLFVALAESTPETVVPVVSSLADRLAAADEFYYVRARCAEALGYVALERPAAVASPEMLADFRLGLSFDEPEVREKLAKALECVASGDPSRLRHHVSTLADHLDDENELVRYRLATALVVIGCEHPGWLVDTANALAERLDDENPHVRGRAAEALGLLARVERDDVTLPESRLEELEADDDVERFVVKRVRFALESVGQSDTPGQVPNEIGSLTGVRNTTDEAVDAITSPDGDGECPHCGLELPEGAPPMCPRCGAPY